MERCDDGECRILFCYIPLPEEYVRQTEREVSGLWLGDKLGATLGGDSCSPGSPRKKGLVDGRAGTHPEIKSAGCAYPPPGD